MEVVSAMYHFGFWRGVMKQRLQECWLQLTFWAPVLPPFLSLSDSFIKSKGGVKCCYLSVKSAASCLENCDPDELLLWVDEDGWGRNPSPWSSVELKAALTSEQMVMMGDGDVWLCGFVFSSDWTLRPFITNRWASAILWARSESRREEIFITKPGSVRHIISCSLLHFLWY